MNTRLNKYLSQNNVCSRRKADELIKKGKVTINDKRAELGDTVDSEKDVVKVNDKIIKENEQDFEYYILNKPPKVLSTVSDDRKRKTVMNFVDSKNNLVPVGRLDYMSTGLILLTNDGKLTYKLTHPKYHLPKTYFVRVKESITQSQLDTIRKGKIPVFGKFTSKAEVKQIDDKSFEIVIHEGLKRQIRESCKHVGLTVIELKRLKMGELELGKLDYGKIRKLTEKEQKYIEYVKSL